MSFYTNPFTGHRHNNDNGPHLDMFADRITNLMTWHTAGVAARQVTTLVVTSTT